MPRRVVQQRDQPGDDGDAKCLDESIGHPATIGSTLVEIREGRRPRRHMERRQRLRDRVGDVRPRSAQLVGELPVARRPRGKILPPPAAFELDEERQRPTQKGLHNAGIRLQPHEIRQEPELCAREIGGVDGLARGDDAPRPSDRQSRDRRPRTPRNPCRPSRRSRTSRRARRSMCRSFDGSTGMSAAGAAPQTRVDERDHRVPAIGRQVQSIESRRQHLGRRRFQLEQETQRVGEIDVGKIAQHRAVRASIEQAGQDRSSQQIGPARRLELQHRPSELSEHHAGEPRIERGEQRRDVREFALERGLALLGSNRVVVGQAQQDRRQLGRVVHEDGEIDRARRCPGERPGRAAPTLCPADRDSRPRPPAANVRLAPALLVPDEIADRRGRRADVEHLRTVGHLRDDRVHAVFHQQLGKRRLGPGEPVAADDVRAEARQVPRRRGAIDLEADDARTMQTSHELVLDDRAGDPLRPRRRSVRSVSTRSTSRSRRSSDANALWQAAIASVQSGLVGG